MKRHINYLSGGLLISLIGSYGYFLGRIPYDPSYFGLIVVGIIYLLYSFNILTENKITKNSFYLVLISVVAITFLNYGVNNAYWPGFWGTNLNSTVTTIPYLSVYLMITIGLVLMLGSIIIGLFKKSEKFIP